MQAFFSQMGEAASLSKQQRAKHCVCKWGGGGAAGCPSLFSRANVLPSCLLFYLVFSCLLSSFVSCFLLSLVFFCLLSSLVSCLLLSLVFSCLVLSCFVLNGFFSREYRMPMSIPAAAFKLAQVCGAVGETSKWIPQDRRMKVLWKVVWVNVLTRGTIGL